MKVLGFFAALVVIAAPSVGFSLPNPATAYCESRGGKAEIERAANGAETGTCVFPNGTRVNEWAYFRSTHRTTK